MSDVENPETDDNSNNLLDAINTDIPDNIPENSDQLTEIHEYSPGNLLLSISVRKTGSKAGFAHKGGPVISQRQLEKLKEPNDDFEVKYYTIPTSRYNVALKAKKLPGVGFNKFSFTVSLTQGIEIGTESFEATPLDKSPTWQTYPE